MNLETWLKKKYPQIDEIKFIDTGCIIYVDIDLGSKMVYVRSYSIKEFFNITESLDSIVNQKWDLKKWKEFYEKP